VNQSASSSPQSGQSGAQSGLPSHERHFYARNRAFGRFGMRMFRPQVMELAHWHGHVEANFCRGAELVYDFNGAEIRIPPGQCVLFWAGVPHQLVQVNPRGASAPILCNIYLPLDNFLLMHFIARLQVDLLSGAMVAVAPEHCSEATIERWYADYRSGDFERCELVKMELNALFRRTLLGPLSYVVAPREEWGSDRSLSSTHIRHVIEMVRFVMENLDAPLTNADITAVTGLHQNYAMGLFSRVMRLPLKRFVIRMRLMRARALLVESSAAIPTVALSSGFSSISQFYHHFGQAYGMSPRELRERYLQIRPRT
jgi:AraC family transcriptional regulator, melibiose operon regulatory protein